MQSSTSNKLPHEIWHLIAIECLEDTRTLFNMLLVNKSMFQITVPVLYRNLPKKIQSFRNAERLEWLLGFSAGLYTVERLPMATKRGDQSWIAFTNTLTVDYYGLVKVMDENWLLEPFINVVSSDIPEVEAANARNWRLQKLAKESELWNRWVECHSEKLEELTLTPFRNWSPELDLNRLNAIVGRFKILERVRISGQPNINLGSRSRWEANIHGGQAFQKSLVNFITEHRKIFSGMLDSVEVIYQPSSTFGKKLHKDILENGLGPQYVQKHVSIYTGVATIKDATLVKSASSLTLYSMESLEDRTLSALLQMAGPHLETLTVIYNHDDWLAWARTTPEDIERAQAQKELQENDVSDLRRTSFSWTRHQLPLSDPFIVPASSSITPLCHPLFPNLKTLSLNGSQIIPILDAMSLFRDSLQTLNIDGHIFSTANRSNRFWWSWRLPKLESLKIFNMNLALDSLCSEYCPNLRFLSLQMSKPQNDFDFRVTGKEAFKSLRFLEELDLSNVFEALPFRNSIIKNHDDDVHGQHDWNISKTEGYYFPYLRKLTCQGWWAVWIQGKFLLVAPRLEVLKLDSSAKEFSTVLDVASFYSDLKQSNTESSSSLDPTLVRPWLRWIELKHWTIQNEHLELFERIFVSPKITLISSTQKLLNLSDILCPRLWKVDLQSLHGLEPNRFVQKLLRQRPELRSLKIDQIGDLDLSKDHYCLRWDPSVMPDPPTLPTSKEKSGSQENGKGADRILINEMKAAVELGLGGIQVKDANREQQFSFSGLKSTVGQCVLHYMGFQYVLFLQT